MSKTRLLVRVLLVVLLIGACSIVYRAWSRGQPSRYWNQAQAAIAENNHESAKISLQNLLSNFPDHAPGHQVMAEVLLAEAKAADRPHTYARVPEARNHLIAAADLRPEDLDLQKQLMNVFLEVGAVGEAVKFASRVVELEPDNVDALYATAWQAVIDNDTDRAQSLLDQLAQHNSPDYFYRTLVSTVRLHTPRDTDEGSQDVGRQQRQEALAAAARRAVTASGEELAGLSSQEYVAMHQLIQTAVAEAEDVPRAHEAARTALEICEKIAAADNSKAGDLSFNVGQIMTLLADNHPLSSKGAAGWAPRRQLSEQAERLWAAAIAKGEATPRIILWSATGAMARGEHEAANETIQKGLAADKGESQQAEAELLRMHLLAARNLLIMRRYDDMQKHLEPLLANEEYKGWGHLISGGVATGQGRHEKALNQYLLAERSMGKNVLVQLGLASTYLKLGRWPQALPLMQSLQGVLDSSDAEQQAWQALHNAFEEQLHWGQFQANLALDRWEEAQPHVQALRGNAKLGPRVLAAAALYQWAKIGRAEAATAVEQARAAYPQDLRLLHLQAILWWQEGRGEEADQLIEALAENARDDLASQMYLVRWRIRRGKADEAMALVEELINRFPLQPAPLMLKARVLLATGKPREAAALAEKLRESPQTAKLGGLLDVATEISQQNLPEAADRLQEFAESLPSSSPAVSLWEGRIAAAQGDFTAAVASVGETLDVTSLRQQARLTLLRSLMLLAVQEGPAKAYDELAPLLERNPDDFFLRIVEADLKFKQGKFDEGIRALDEVERLQPDRPSGAYLKAAAWAQKGDVNRALEGVNRALRIDDQNLASHILAAQLNLAAAKFEPAMEHAQTVLEKNPNQWQMYLIQADALNQLDRRRQAVALLEQVIEKEPRFLAAHRGLAMLYLMDKQPEQALAACRRARKVLPDVFTLIADEISILCSQKQLETAQQLAQDVVGDPPDAAKCVILGQTFKGAGQEAAAREWGARAMELADENLQPTVHLLLGELALSEGQRTSDRQLLAESRDHFAAVHEVQPTHFIAGNNLAWLLATEFDEPEKALAVVEQVRGQATVGQMPLGFVDTLAVVYRKANQLEKAQTVLEEAIAYQPDQPKLLFHLGMVLADRNRRAAARTSLERALQLQGLSDAEMSQARRRLQTLDEQASAPSDVQ